MSPRTSIIALTLALVACGGGGGAGGGAPASASLVVTPPPVAAPAASAVGGCTVGVQSGHHNTRGPSWPALSIATSSLAALAAQSISLLLKKL
jgi:hypothetical protein